MVIVLVIGLVQGLTIQEVGIPGVASVKFAQKDTPKGDDGSPTSSRESSTSGSTTDGLTGSGVVTGSWTGARDEVTMEVTTVENQSGHLRISARLTNGTADSITLSPLQVMAIDDTGRSYQMDPSGGDFPLTVASGQSVTGVIEFEGLYRPSDGPLTLTVADFFGFDAPRGGLVVEGIDQPAG